MTIQKLSLTNFRDATNLHLDLDPRVNVFVGLNGSGKSTVLDAVAVLLSWVANRLNTSGASGRPIAESDIQNGKSTARIGLECERLFDLFDWELVKERPGRRGQEQKSRLKGATDLVQRLQAVLSGHTREVRYPLFAYYPVNRAVIDIPLRIREKHVFDVFAAYDGSLTSGANFRTFFEWFREREDLENENRKYLDLLLKPDDFVFPDPQLEAVRKALQSFMPDFKNLTVRRKPLRMEVEKAGRRLTVNQLSDGEKILMALVGDLARRLAILNEGVGDPLHGAGIVLIDEIDLHLHPKWQRMVVPKLREVFPECQFLISTHSPHVITHVKPQNLHLLRQTPDGIKAERPHESYGKTVTRVLEDLMDLETTRPLEVQDLLDSLYRDIGEGKLPAAKEALAGLRAEIGDDPELGKARVLIRRKEVLGK